MGEKENSVKSRIKDGKCKNVIAQKRNFRTQKQKQKRNVRGRVQEIDTVSK
jgi:hypothetical protein